MITMDVEAGHVVARLTRMKADVRAKLMAAVTGLAIELRAYVVDRKLSGQVLKRRSGRLSRSIAHKVEVDKESVIGIVGTNVEYAGFHEFGFTGVEQVKDHYRHITQAFGRPITPREVFVRAHQRSINYGGRPFLRPSLGEMENKIRAKIDRAVQEAVEQ